MERFRDLGMTDIFTFVFTDIEGSTTLAYELGEGWIDVLNDHHALLRDAFRAHGGEEVRTEGDAFFIAFEDPHAAAAACLRAQRAVGAHAFPHGRPLKVRMGANTGPATRAGRDFVGFAVHEAARVAAAGHGGQVLLSQATTHAIGEGWPDGSTVRDLGPHALKDIPEAKPIFQLCHPELESVFPPLKSLSATGHNVPLSPSAIVGRRDELADVNELLLGDARLVTLTGPGGVGKTRLSLEVARSLLAYHRGGVWFATLAGVTDPDLLLSEVASVLGIADTQGREPIDVLRDRFSGDRTLLVLDNLEQVVEGAPQIAELLSACPDLRVLATSRERLRLRGEHAVAVGPLTDDDAVRLFVERASAIDRSFAHTAETAPAVARICSTLEGMPLALELAASAVADHGLDHVASGIERSLDLLTEGERDLPARQRSLRAVIAWGYDLLGTEHRRTFERLAAFVGGFDLDAAEDVAGARGQLCADLVRKSLLVSEGDGRCSMLEPIRQFAMERLSSSGDEAGVFARHAGTYARLAARTDRELDGPDQVQWIQRLERDADNVRAAIDRSSPDDALAIATDTARFWAIRGRWTEGRVVLERVLDGASPDAPARARALLLLGQIVRLQGDLSAARSLFVESEALAEGNGEPSTRALAFQQLGEVARIESDLDGAKESLERSLELARSVDDDRAVARALNSLGALALAKGDVAEATERLEQSSTILTRIGDLRTLATARLNLGVALNQTGESDRVASVFREALETYEAIGNEAGAANVRLNLAIHDAQLGDFERAIEGLTEVVETLKDLGDRVRERAALTNLNALILQHREDPVMETAVLLRILELSNELDDPDGADSMLERLAEVAVRAGDRATAIQRYRRYIANRRARGDTEGEAQGIEALRALENDEAPDS